MAGRSPNQGGRGLLNMGERSFNLAALNNSVELPTGGVGFNSPLGGIDLPPSDYGVNFNPGLQGFGQGGNVEINPPTVSQRGVTIGGGGLRANSGGTAIGGFGGSSPFFGTFAPSGLYGPGAGPTAIPTTWGPSSGQRAGPTPWSSAPSVFSSLGASYNPFGSFASGFPGTLPPGGGFLGYGPNGAKLLY